MLFTDQALKNMTVILYLIQYMGLIFAIRYSGFIYYILEREHTIISKFHIMGKIGYCDERVAVMRSVQSSLLYRIL